MAVPTPIAPLEITRRLHIPLEDVALQLDVTPDWLRRLARDPKHSRRILVAELAAALRHERLALTLESLVDAGRCR